MEGGSTRCLPQSASEGAGEGSGLAEGKGSRGLTLEPRSKQVVEAGADVPRSTEVFKGFESLKKRAYHWYVCIYDFVEAFRTIFVDLMSCIWCDLEVFINNIGPVVI